MLKCHSPANDFLMYPGGQVSSPRSENESLQLTALLSTVHHVSAVRTQPGERSMREDPMIQSNRGVGATFG